MATSALVAVSGALVALLASWLVGVAVLVMAAFGASGSGPPQFTEEDVTKGSGILGGLSAGAATLLVFVVTLTAIRIKSFRNPEAHRMSASCVTASTMLATTAMLLLMWLADGQYARLIMLGGAIVIWCAALAGTVPTATYAWTAVLGAVSIGTISVASAMAKTIRW